jgi:starvation-inducible DNA-binding protein
MMNLGMNNEKNKQTAFGVSTILADTYTLYLKSQNFHWNVTGPRFHQLHQMFEEHYTEMAHAIDEIAERIRALGHRAPGTFDEFKKLTSLEEEHREISAEEMLGQLINDHETLARKSREVIQIAEKHHDDATADLLTSRMKTHEKFAWMLRSSKA